MRASSIWGVRWTVCLWLTIMLACTAGGPAGSAPQTPPQAPPAPAFLQKPIKLKLEKVTLREALHLLNERFGLNFAVDGYPAVQTADFEFKGTANDAVNRVAEVFDYSWSATRSRVVILNKRFRNRDELPQVHLSEIKQMTRDILASVSSFPYDAQDGNWTDNMHAFAKSLTREQRAFLEQGGTLPVRQLWPEQFDRLQAVNFAIVLAHTRSTWETANRLWSGLPTSSLRVLRYVNAQNYQMNQYDSTGAAMDHPFVFIPVVIQMSSHPE